MIMENMFMALFNSLNCKITILTNKIYALHWYTINYEPAIIKVGNSGDNLTVYCNLKWISQKDALYILAGYHLLPRENRSVHGLEKWYKIWS